MSDARPSGMFAPLKHRDFTAMWAGFLLSHVGDSIQLHAQAWLVTSMTRSGAGTGAVVVAQAVPRLVLGLFAGVAVDRLDKRKVLVFTQLAALAQTLLFFWLVRSGRITYSLVIALAFALGVIDTLNLNARVTLLPTLVPKPMIARAIALQALGVNLVQISGPSLAGVIIGEWDVAGCLIANALTFAFALGALAVIRPPAHVEGPSASVRDALREGFRFVRERPVLMGGVALAWLHGFFGVSVVRLYALFARSVLHVDGRQYGLLAACGGVGAILASVLVTARSTAENLRRNIAWASVFFSLSVLALGLSTRYGAAMVAVMAVGAGQMAFRSAVSTRIQIETPDRLRGRVMSLLTLDFSLWSFGALAIGALGDGFSRALGVPAPDGLRWSFVLGGVLCLLCAARIAPQVLHKKEPEPV